MKLDLETIEQSATAAGDNDVLALVALARRQERELAAARAEQGPAFGYITPSALAHLVAPDWRASFISISVRRERSEQSTVPLFFTAAQVAPVVAASEGMSKAIHYPECWDTAAYPTAASALAAVYEHFRCTNDDCAAPAASVAVPADDRVRAALEVLRECRPDQFDRALFAAIPDAGYALVPLEPTDEMRAATKHLAYASHIDEDWAAMLAAAPATPAAQAQQPAGDGWKPNTGVQPVADDVLVDVKFRNHKEDQGIAAGDFYWSLEGQRSDIVSYRLSAPAPGLMEAE